MFALGLWLAAATAVAREDAVPPAPQRWLTDTVGLLSPAAGNALDDRLGAYQRQTGHQVVVWIGSTLGTALLEDFAVRTFQAWRLGRKGLDDGMLVLVLAEDRKIAVEVGYGLEGQVPDAVVSRIIRDVMAPKLLAGDADAAIASGVDALLEAVEGKPFVQNERGSEGIREPYGVGKIVLFVVVGVAFLLLFMTNPGLALSLLFVMGSRGGRGGFGGGGFGGGGGRSGGGGGRGGW